MSQFVQETRQVKPRLRSATRNVKGQDFAVDIKGFGTHAVERGYHNE